MIIAFRCDQCGAKIRVQGKFAGAKMRCQTCGDVVIVPQDGQQPTAAPAPEPSTLEGLAKRVPWWRGSFLPAASLADYGAKSGFIWGALLLIGSLLPLIVHRSDGSYELVSLSFEWLPQQSVPGTGTVKFLLLYPSLAGVAAILVSRFAKGMGRGLALAAMGMFAIISAISLGLLVSGVFSLVPELLKSFLPELATVSQLVVSAIRHIFVFVCAAVLLLVGLFVGLRILKAYPVSLFGRLMAGICGTLLLLMLALPILPGGYIALLAPFDIISVSRVGGLLAILALACLMTVAIIGCMTFPARPDRNGFLASLGLGIMLTSLLVFPVVAVAARFRPAYEAGDISFTMAFMVLPLAWAIKLELWFYGLMALLAVGVIDLYGMVRRPQPPMKASAGDDN